MKTQKSGANRSRKRTRVLFWYEIVFLVIIAFLVFMGGDFIRLILRGGLTGIFDVKATASILIETPPKEVNKGEDADKKGPADSPENGEADTTPVSADIAVPGENKRVFIMDGKLLLRSSHSLTGYNAEGDKISERDLGGRNTKILEYGDKYIIYEDELGIIALVGGDNKLIKELRLDQEIESLKVSKERIFVKPRAKNSILFLDNELNEQGSVDIKNREFIFMEANFDSSELLCYNTEIVGNSLSSSVIVFNKHQKVIASLDLNGALMLDMHAGNSLFLLTDMAIMNYSKDLKPIYEKAYDGEITLSVMDKNRLYFIMDKSMRAGGREFIVYGSEGEDGYLTLKSNIEQIRLGKKYILLASMDKIAILNYNIKVMKELNFIENIEEIDWIDEDHFFLRSGNKVSIYSIN